MAERAQIPLWDAYILFGSLNGKCTLPLSTRGGIGAGPGTSIGVAMLTSVSTINRPSIIDLLNDFLVPSNYHSHYGQEV